MQFFVLIQYVMPKKAITAMAGKFANKQAGWLTTQIIAWFVKRYQVNMTEAANPDIKNYATFNDFFTRPLRKDARPIAHANFICPVDGAISQLGQIEKDQIFQAKGHQYSTVALVGGNQALAHYFENGSFACIYLSPKDYHRIHMPCDGTLKRMIYIPGDLFSVNPTTAQGVPNLFIKNERVICEFESTTHGKFIMVLVGATIVGSIATLWHGIINPPRTRQSREWLYENNHINLKQGDEMGKFLLGSTVVLLFQKDVCQFNSHWQATTKVQLGQAMNNAPH